jgi:hypothetical protein
LVHKVLLVLLVPLVLKVLLVPLVPLVLKVLLVPLVPLVLKVLLVPLVLMVPLVHKVLLVPLVLKVLLVQTDWMAKQSYLVSLPQQLKVLTVIFILILLLTSYMGQKQQVHGQLV